MSDVRQLALPQGMTDEDAEKLKVITVELERLWNAGRPVLVTYWREGIDMPLDRSVFTPEWLPRVVRMAPLEATHVAFDEAQTK